MYDKFEELLKKSGVSAYKVSKTTGIATSTLSDWKNGRSTPKTDKLEKIADYFNVPLEYFTTGKTYQELQNENLIKETLNVDIASQYLLKEFATIDEMNELTEKDKEDYKNYLLELAELAYLKVRKQLKNKDK